MARGATGGRAARALCVAAGCRAGDKPQTGSAQTAAAQPTPLAPMVRWSSGDQVHVPRRALEQLAERSFAHRRRVHGAGRAADSPPGRSRRGRGPRRAARRRRPHDERRGAPLPAGLARDLASPWGFELADGTYRALRARGNISPFALGILNTLAAGVQSPSRLDRADAGTARTDHAEADASGTYRAHYAAGADADELTRTKTAYDDRTLAKTNLPFGPLNATPAVIESKGTLKVRGDDLFSVASHDVLEASLTATSKVRVTTDLALTLVDHTQQAPADWATLRGSTIVLHPGQIPPQQGPDPYDLKLAADTTFPRALAAAEKESTPDAGSTVDPMSSSAPDEATAGARETTFATLVALLRTRPGTVALATKAIDRGSRARRVLIDALGAASTTESLAALVPYVQRTTEPRDVREMAAFALIRTPHPNAASIDGLVGLIDNPDVRSYAVLGLGTYSRRLREAGDIDQANRAADALVPLLGTARSEADRVEVLQGIANSGDGRAFPRVRPLVDDPDQAVRAAAVDAMRLMPNPEVDALVAARMDPAEKIPVRLEAIDAARLRGGARAAAVGRRTGGHVGERLRVAPQGGAGARAVDGRAPRGAGDAREGRARRLARGRAARRAGGAGDVMGWRALLGIAMVAIPSGACMESESKGAPLAEAGAGSSAPSTGANAAAPTPAAVGAQAPADPALCASICAHSGGLHCPEAASCVRRCVAMQSVPQCQAEIRAALGCFDATPPAGWTCNDHGLPSVRVGLCDAEQARVARCLAASPPVAPR